MSIPRNLMRNPFPRVKWDPKQKPVLVLDGRVIPLKQLSEKVCGKLAYIVGINEKTYLHVRDYVTAETFHFYEMRVSNISWLAQYIEMQGLAIHWNTKLADIFPLASLKKLKHLVLEHTPKVFDLAPLANCLNLEMLEFSGGIWATNTAKTLEPLANLPSLQHLYMTNLKIKEGGLKPLAKLSQLKELEVSNQFLTEDYAYLSVHLTKTRCSHFSPYVKLPNSITGNDIMVVGVRKPFLDSRKDKEKIKKYEEEFSQLKTRFIAEK